MRVLQIGLGRRGKNILRNLVRLRLEEKIEEIYVYDVVEEAIKRAREAYKIIKRGSLEGDYDAVLIVTPPGTHYELAKRFLERGIAAFIEKPPVLSLEDLEELLKYKEIVSADMLLRYSPIVEFLRGLSFEFLEAYRSSVPSKSVDVSVVRDIMIHDIDLAFYLYGSRRVSFVESLYEIEGFPKPAAVKAIAGEMSFLSARTKKGIKLRERRLFTPDALYIVDTSRNVVKIVGEESIERPLYAEEPLYLSIKDFIEAVEKRREPRNSLSSMRDTIAACVEIDEKSRA